MKSPPALRSLTRACRPTWQPWQTSSCTRWCKFRKETRNPQSGSDALSLLSRPKPQDGWRQRQQINSLCLEAASSNPWQFWPAASAGWPWWSHGGCGGLDGDSGFWILRAWQRKPQAVPPAPLGQPKSGSSKLHLSLRSGWQSWEKNF